MRGRYMVEQNDVKIVWKGRHLSMADRDGWEFAIRNTRKPSVGIVAIMDDHRVVLVEQYRPPVKGKVIELPAGLVGDLAGSENESLLECAKRELYEETGYSATTWTELIRAYSSPGLTDESIVLFLAEGLTKSGRGGGDAGEDIAIHEVQLDQVVQWLSDRGGRADLKLLAALHLTENQLRKRGTE